MKKQIHVDELLRQQNTLSKELKVILDLLVLGKELKHELLEFVNGDVQIIMNGMKQNKHVNLFQKLIPLPLINNVQLFREQKLSILFMEEVS